MESNPVAWHGFSAPERVRFRDALNFGGDTHDMS
jgi:hypothetical protein